jgi:hypothetical protein
MISRISPLSPSCRLYEPEAGVDQSRALWTRIFTFLKKPFLNKSRTI